MAEQFFDVFENLPDSSWQVDEAVTSEVDGVSILAKARGPFFLVDGASRNGRYYSKGLWETAIKKASSSLQSGTMLGSIGHDVELDDKALMEGKASHRVSKLWIDEKTGIGMGEVLVLNTPAGRNLNGYLRGGVKFPVSSRATGDYTGRKVQGANELNPQTFNLERFDFVRTPGVETAVPKLIESHSGSINHDDGEKKMSDVSKEVFEQMAKEKISIQSELDSALAANKNLNLKVELLNEKFSQADEATKALEAKVAELLEKATAVERFGGIEHIAESFEKLEKFESIPADVSEIQTRWEAMDKLGTVEDITEVFDVVESLIADNGTLEEIKEKLAFASAHDASEVQAKFELLQKFEELGSYDEVKEALESSLALAGSLKEQKKSMLVEKLASETGVPVATAQRLFEQLDGDYDGAKELIESIAAKEDCSERYRVREDSEETVSESDEGEERPTALHESRAMRMFNAGNGVRK